MSPESWLFLKAPASSCPGRQKRKARRQQLHKAASSRSVSSADKLDKSVASWNRCQDSSASQLSTTFDCASAEAVEAGKGPAAEQAISDQAQPEALLPFWQVRQRMQPGAAQLVQTALRVFLWVPRVCCAPLITC